MKTIELGCALGECILWDARTGYMWLTDILGHEMIRITHETGEVMRIKTPHSLCAFGLTDDPEVLVAAFTTGFAYYAPYRDDVRWLHQPQELADGALRLNDGRVDPQGRFWCGSMILDADAAGARTGTLYCLSGAGDLSVHETGIGISNGLCWSPEHDRQYFSDCVTSEMYAYDYDALSGAISNRKVIALTSDGASPDGAITDADGHIWSAQWGASRLVRFTPDGQLVETVAVPTAQPTCVTFGGPDLSTLYVSSARTGLEDMADQHQAGHVFVYEVAARGLPASIFKS
ncbi:MAG: SMP-30/gluconolactonase/LRE family protein [Asticcacaulis sp.]